MHLNTLGYIKAHKKITLSLVFLFIILSAFIISKSTYAAENSISVKEINYEKSTITLQANSGDTTIYYSDSNKKTWDIVPGELSSSSTITMDISWVTQTANYTMTFKGDKSTGIVTVKLPKQATDFKATFNVAKGAVSFTNVNSRTIQWRKKNSTSWNTVDTSTISTELSYLYNNGATVLFRLAPTNGTSITNVGSRPSKEISVTIPKRTNAPTISIDGSKLVIPIKKGMAYRTVKTDGGASDWVNVISAQDLSLYTIASDAMYNVSNTGNQKEVKLQFRTNATSATQVSKITSVTVPVQEGPPDLDTNGISFSYTSPTKLSIQVKSASSSTPYEYTIVDKDDEFNYKTAKWVTISSNSAVTVSSTTAPASSHIYLRKKSIVASSTTDFKLASVETELTGQNGVTYPDSTKINTLTTLITIAGECKTSKSSSYLAFNLYSANSVTVSSISFQNSYGITKGTVTCKSSVTKNLNSIGSDDKYIITTKITSTNDIDSYTEEKLYAKITLSNDEVITSTTSTGVLLYIYPSTKVNNPTDDDYKASFKRIYMSNDTDDDTAFKFKLDLGTEKLIDFNGIDTYASDTTQISSIKFDNYTLASGTDYTIEYGSYVNDEGDKIATATVKVNVSDFEKSTLITTTDKALPLVITVNNNEVLDDDIYITLVNTAKIDNSPISWSITKGSLKETVTSTVTNSDGSTSSVTNEAVSYTLTCTLFDKQYGVGVTDVTWGGTSILNSSTVSDGKVTIYLSNTKINKLSTSSSDTKNLIISFSNGYVISSGCKMTIINSQ